MISETSRTFTETERPLKTNEQKNKKAAGSLKKMKKN